MNDKTIIYYTSNREKPEFERKIIESLKKQAGDIPIISVSQKPMNLGKNICVGDVGHSYLNEFRQILIGLKECKTPYYIHAEADFLYPPEYFIFEPAGDNIYRYDNVWIVLADSSIAYSYRRKRYSEGAQICKTDFMIEVYETWLKSDNLPEWYDGYLFTEKTNRDISMRSKPFIFFHGAIPCVSFKTGKGMRLNTSTLSGRENMKSALPLWGKVDELRKEYL